MTSPASLRQHIRNEGSGDWFLAKTLKWMQAQLNHFFIRTHQSYFINLTLVERYDLQDATLPLEGGVQVSVSRSMKKEMREYFKA